VNNIIKKILRPFYYKYLTIKKNIQLHADTVRLCQISGEHSPKVFYFGITEHSNMGDMAQCYCIRSWITENFNGIKVYEFAASTVVDDRFGFLDKLEKCLIPEDIIVFQSGYTTQDLGGVHELMHRIVIDRFPNARIIMMPQTIFFKSQERRKLTSISYNQAKNMLFLARDRVSYGMALEMFPNIMVRQFPDIVTSLIGTYSFSNPRSGILFCCRNDSEKLYSDDEITALRSRLELLQKTEYTDTTISVDFKIIQKDIKHYLELEIGRYAHYKLIITDRYHGTIFSLIANTPVIVIKTNDHKVTTGVEWFDGVYDGYVYLADSLDDVYLLAEQVLKRGFKYSLKPYFKKEYYDNLQDLAYRFWRGKNLV